MIDDENEDIDEVLPADNSMKRKVLLYLIPAIIIIGVAVGFVVVFFTNINSSSPKNYDIVSQKSADGSGEKLTVFYTLPEITANIRTSNGIFEIVRIKLNIELSSVEDIENISPFISKIRSIIISHLVELTPEEISGSNGFHALKSELLYRIKLIVSPIEVLNVNITDLNIQITDALEKQED